MFFVCLSYRKSPSSRTIILSQVLLLICLRWLGKYGLVQLPTSFLLTFFDCCNSRAQLSDIHPVKATQLLTSGSGVWGCLVGMIFVPFHTSKIQVGLDV